jgi:hypothetical protein
MYDSVDVSQIPADAEAVAGYTSGKWPTYNALVTRFPKAHHLSIAINAHEYARCLDVENGDATNAEAPGWFKNYAQKSAALPAIFYSSFSNIAALVKVLANAGIPRSAYLIWSADYFEGAPRIDPGCDATQYWDKALGRNLDVSLCLDKFFGAEPAPKPVNTWQPGDEHNWCVEWDRIVGKKELRYHLRRLYLRGRLLARRRQITKLANAHKNGWQLENRLYRYHQLQIRSH